jgi:hypothetical protein
MGHRHRQSAEQFGVTLDTLFVDGTRDASGRCVTLGHAVQSWARSANVELDVQSRRDTELARKDRTVGLSL